MYENIFLRDKCPLVLRSATRIREGVSLYETESVIDRLEIISWQIIWEREERERKMANIIDDGENFNGKILSWAPRNDQTYGRHMRIFHTATHAPILQFCAFFCSPLLAWGGIVLPRNTSGSITTRTNFFARFSNGCKASRESLKARLWRKYRRKYLVRSSGGSLSRVLKGYIFRRNVSMV